MTATSPANWQVDLAVAGRQASPAGWDALVADRSLPAVWDWAALGAWVAARRRRVLGAVVRDDATVRAAFCAVPRAVRLPGLPQVGARLLEVRLPLATAVPGRYFAPDCPGPQRVAAVRAFEDAVAKDGAGVQVVVHRGVGAGDLGIVLGRRGVAAQEQPVAVLPIRWDSYDGYLRSLSRSRRHDLRRQGRRVAEDTDVLVTWTAPGGDDVHLPPDTMTRLESASGDRQASTHRVPASRSTPAVVLQRVQRHPGVRTLAYRSRDGRLLAFGLLLDSATTPVGWTWGALPVSEGGRQHLWFDMVQRMVRHAIERGCDSFVLGKGLLDLKQSLGFEPSPRWAVVAAR
jgi:Acetyltransferase (GNAT) domain